MQKHRETSLKAQSVSAVAASVAALHHVLLCTCPKAAVDLDDASADWPSSSENVAEAYGSWKVNKPVKLLIQMPGILQQAANGVDVLKVQPCCATLEQNCCVDSASWLRVGHSCSNRISTLHMSSLAVRGNI